MKFIVLLILFSSATVLAAESPNSQNIYRYELETRGEAPTEFSIEGWNANLAKSCRTNTEDKVVTCTGTINALTILPHGIILIQGPVAADQLKIKIYQICENLSEREVTSLQNDPIRSNSIEGLFYVKIDALLDPCNNNQN